MQLRQKIFWFEAGKWSDIIMWLSRIHDIGEWASLFWMHVVAGVGGLHFCQFFEDMINA